MKARAIIADDEPTLVDYLTDLLTRAWPALEVVGTAPNGRRAMELIDSLHPDVVFLDIHMPGATGLDVARRCPAGTQIVFVTAHDEYAVAAFERAAIDYVLKPVTPRRLAVTVQRLQARLARRESIDLAALTSVLESVQGGAPKYLRWLKVGKTDSVTLVAVDDVLFFQADQKYTSAHTADAQHVIRVPLKDLEAQLDPQLFWRIHRGTLVNASAIAQARKDFRGRIVVKLKHHRTALTVSAAYTGLFRQM